MKYMCDAGIWVNPLHTWLSSAWPMGRQRARLSWPKPAGGRTNRCLIEIRLLLGVSIKYLGI